MANSAENEQNHQLHDELHHAAVQASRYPYMKAALETMGKVTFWEYPFLFHGEVAKRLEALETEEINDAIERIEAERPIFCTHMIRRLIKLRDIRLKMDSLAQKG
jgi:DNA-binding GntR family transcriptional regulator